MSIDRPVTISRKELGKMLIDSFIQEQKDSKQWKKGTYRLPPMNEAYFNKYPTILPHLTEHLTQCAHQEIKSVGSLELGATKLGREVALTLKKPYTSLIQIPKLNEQSIIQTKPWETSIPLTLIEGTVQKGGQLAMIIPRLKEEGITVQTVYAAVHHDSDPHSFIQYLGVPFKSLFSSSDLFSYR